jgi:hypothetical protein
MNDGYKSPGTCLNDHLFNSFIIKDIRNRKNMGIIGDESNVDPAYAPFLFQSSRQVFPPLLYEDIIA